jgi:hemerythrin-like metal-binding protein
MIGIRWRSAMAIDHGVIDDDHRHLIDIINRFGQQVSRGTAGLDGAIDVLHALEFYAETHFEREERLQRLISYPETDLQRDEHRHLMKTLGDIVARTRSVTEAETATVVPELTSLLRSWLLDHVIKLDLRMKPYAQLMNQHARGLIHLRDIHPTRSIVALAR